MIILIDAYNVLKQTISAKITEKERNSFIKMLSVYRSQKKNEIIVVFDGGPTRAPSIEDHHGIKVVYSGKNSADSYIMDYISTHRNLDLFLVSSDREVISFASSAGVPSLAGPSFYRLVQQAVEQTPLSEGKKSIAVKTSSSSESSVDILMYEASQHLENKAEEMRDERKSLPRSLTKQERILQKKLKKL